MPPIILAATKGDLNLAKLLVESGADVNDVGYFNFHRSCKWINEGTVITALHKRYDEHPKYEAITDYFLNLVSSETLNHAVVKKELPNFYVQKEHDPGDIEGITPLMLS